MTPAHRAYYRGLTMAAHASAAIARAAREAGNLPEYLCRSAHAQQLAEDARIVRGDTEALLDRTERVLEHEYLLERERERELVYARLELEREALEATAAALANRRARRNSPLCNSKPSARCTPASSP
jgi:hypothetical protein